MRKRKTNLEAFMRLTDHCIKHTGSLDDIHGPASEPWTLELFKERLLYNEGSDTRRETKHLVEADSHGIYRVLCQGED